MTRHIRYIFLAVCLATVVFTLGLSSFLVEHCLEIYCNVETYGKEMHSNGDAYNASLQEVHALSVQSVDNPPIEIPRFSLLAVGDMMLDRSVYLHTQKAGDYTFPFEKISSFLDDWDLRLGNLEGPITTSKSVANGTGGNRLVFTFSSEFVQPLRQNFEFLSLANNHTTNFGKKGLDQTRQFLREESITFFGDPNNFIGFISTTTEKQNISFALIGYHQLVEKGLSDVVDEIERLDPIVDVVIVMPHWGNEYVTTHPSAAQKKEAHAFIDAGADVIFGAHPHVIQPIEEYKDKVIFYSLGNFIFDQYFSEETTQGLTVGMTVTKEEDKPKLSFELFPVEISKQSQPALASEDVKKKILESLAKVSIVEEGAREGIRGGILR